MSLKVSGVAEAAEGDLDGEQRRRQPRVRRRTANYFSTTYFQD